MSIERVGAAVLFALIFAGLAHTFAPPDLKLLAAFAAALFGMVLALSSQVSTNRNPTPTEDAAERARAEMEERLGIKKE